jgi:hypothetical protein
MMNFINFIFVVRKSSDFYQHINFQNSGLACFVSSIQPEL